MLCIQVLQMFSGAVYCTTITQELSWVYSSWLETGRCSIIREVQIYFVIQLDVVRRVQDLRDCWSQGECIKRMLKELLIKYFKEDEIVVESGRLSILSRVNVVISTDTRKGRPVEACKSRKKVIRSGLSEWKQLRGKGIQHILIFMEIKGNILSIRYCSGRR